MSLELLNAFATLGTFVVIGVTAIIAIVQLRHARGSNQIEALDELRTQFETAEFSSAKHFVDTELKKIAENPEFRHQVAELPARTDQNTREAGLVERHLALEFWGGIVPSDWGKLAPITAILRRAQGDGVWENFEYMVVLSEDYIAAHPKGSYPTGVRRIQLRDEWLDADRQYAASLASP